MFTRLLSFNRDYPCHVVYNRCGYCNACKVTMR